MYKDKDKQREAVREATRRYRERRRGCDTRTGTIPYDTPDVILKGPEPQTHSPMMVGYVPPEQ